MSAEWTAEPKPCFFCPKLDNGYSLQDNQGVWQAACWECVKKRLNKKEEKNGNQFDQKQEQAQQNQA